MFNNSVHITVYCDGAARGNPGAAAYGFVVKDQSGLTLLSGSRYLGIATNNEAEYQGIIAALEAISKSCFQISQMISCQADLASWDIDARLDSQLVVEQLNGHYRTKDPRMKAYAQKTRQLSGVFHSVIFQWIPREKNKEADKLANIAIDKAVLTGR